ncbi:MAG: O-antigen ligase family protein [Gemmatimonadota bacterium]
MAEAYAPDRPDPSDRVPWGLLGAAAVAGGLVALLGALGPALQVAVVLGVGLGFPLLLLFVVRPHMALAAYLAALPLVLPVPLAGGLNAGELLTLAILVLGALSLWEARERVVEALFRLAPFLVPLAGLGVVSVVSLVVNGITALEDVVSALFKVLAFGLVAVLVHMHADTRGKARTLLAGAALGAALVAVYAVTAWLLGWSYSAEFDWNRASGTFENWNLLGGFMALMSMPTLALAAMVRRRGVKLLLGTAFVLEILALLLSLTLGSLLGLVVGAGFTVLFLMEGGRKRVVPALVLGALAFGVAFSTNPQLRDKVMRIDERLNDRLITYAVGINMFRDRFWWGFGSEWRLAEELQLGEADYGITSFGQAAIVPHNSFLKIGVEKGVMGVILFTAVVLGALHVLFRHRARLKRSPSAPLYYGTAAGVLAFLVQNMTNDILLHARIGIVFFVLLAVLDRVAMQTGEA